MKSTSQGSVDRAHQVGEEEDGALQHADEQRVAARVVARDLRAQLADAVLQIVRLDQDLADRRVAHEGAECRSPALGVQHPRSATARTPPPRSSIARPVRRRAATSSACFAAPGTSLPAAPSASRCTTSRAQRGRQRRKALERDLEPPGASSSCSPTSASSTSPSSRSSSAVRSTLAAAAGWICSSAGTSPLRTRLRAYLSPPLRHVVAPGQAALLAVGGRLRARDAEQRAHEQPVARAHAEQRAAARRGGEPVEDRLDLVVGGVARGDDGVALAPRRARASSRPRSARRAPTPGCSRPASGRRGRSIVSSTPSCSHSAAQWRSSSPASSRSP